MENRSVNASNIVGSVIVTGEVGGNLSIGSMNLTSPKESISEVMEQIQRLLKQLESTNPTATEVQQVNYLNIAIEPSLKERAITALREGSETAIEEFLLENKYLKVCKAVFKGWLQSGC
jgi:hypothetical protein